MQSALRVGRGRFCLPLQSSLFLFSVCSVRPARLLFQIICWTTVALRLNRRLCFFRPSSADPVRVALPRRPFAFPSERRTHVGAPFQSELAILYRIYCIFLTGRKVALLLQCRLLEQAFDRHDDTAHDALRCRNAKIFSPRSSHPVFLLADQSTWSNRLLSR